MNIQEAVDAQRFHQQWLPDITYLEQGFSAAIVKGLEGMGHHIEFGEEDSGTREPYWSDGECIMVTRSRERVWAPATSARAVERWDSKQGLGAHSCPPPLTLILGLGS